jgi:hypothetical protein
MKRTTKYVALDVHQATIVAAIRAQGGGVIARGILPTEPTALVEFFRGMRGFRPVVEKTYTWRELAEAHRRVAEGRVTGKLAVVSAERPGAG